MRAITLDGAPNVLHSRDMCASPRNRRHVTGLCLMTHAPRCVNHSRRRKLPAGGGVPDPARLGQILSQLSEPRCFSENCSLVLKSPLDTVDPVAHRLNLSEPRDDSQNFKANRRTDHPAQGSKIRPCDAESVRRYVLKP